MLRRGGGALVIAAGVMLAAAPATAETLAEALARVYRSNPDLTAARAALRAVDEGVPLARAQSRPSLSGTVGLAQSFNGIGTLESGGRALTGGLTLDYPLFQGGLVKNSVRAAEARVEAGRGDLRATEATTFTDAVAAYLDVIRDQSIVDLNAGQVRVLETNLQANRDRFEVGDLTRTDVAQSEARLAVARSTLDGARAQLVASQENYRRIIGQSPINLEPPPPLPAMPGTAQQAVDVAAANNPNLVAVRQAQEASRYDVGVARAGRLPRLSAQSGATYSNYLGTLRDALGLQPGIQVDEVQTTSRVGFALSVPLYQGGAPAAQVRQAQARQSQAIEQTIAVERAVVAQARSAFASWRAAQEVIRSSEVAIEANRLALEGTRAENSVGTRNILDVLNAEQELLNTQVTLVRARRDEYVAGFALLAAMGRAEARDLGLEGGAFYDPTVNYQRVRGRFNDWDSDETPVPQATRTVDAVDVTPLRQ